MNLTLLASTLPQEQCKDSALTDQVIFYTRNQRSWASQFCIQEWKHIQIDIKNGDSMADQETSAVEYLKAAKKNSGW